jgi:Arc/MetJ-type ribon-helix-helix transcriptional regulator
LADTDLENNFGAKRLMTRFDIRLSEDIAEQIHRAVSERGFESVTAFIRQSISNELRQGSPALGEMEARIAASNDRLSKEVRRLQTAQQAQYAMVDSFVRLFLMCIPEPSGNSTDPAKARAALRYNNFIKNVARNMTGNSRTALEQLFDHE